ncbi:MAG TPA: hypothetical protein VE135_10235 [Pyrinomonadaceae bacterium]|nr:hypothetical protein [Pyrinomonadaceae bacterium]
MNPKCGEDLVPWNERYSGTYGTGYLRQARTGRFLCPSCRYIGKRAFAIGVGLAGLVFGLLKVWAKL